MRNKLVNSNMLTIRATTLDSRSSKPPYITRLISYGNVREYDEVY